MSADFFPDAEGMKTMPVIKRLAKYKSRLAVWKRAHTSALWHWNNDTRVKQGPEPTFESTKPEHCDPSDFGLDGEYQQYADKIRKEMIGI